MSDPTPKWILKEKERFVKLRLSTMANDTSSGSKDARRRRTSCRELAGLGSCKI